MDKAFDPSTIRQVLLRGIKAGHWTLDDLDQPSQGWTYAHQQSKRIHGFTHPPFINLIREPDTAEAVQPIAPRDFDVAAAARPNKGQRHVDVLPYRWPDDTPLSGQRDAGHLSSDQDARANGADHGQSPYLGTTGYNRPPGPTALRRTPLEPGQYLEEPPEPDL